MRLVTQECVVTAGDWGDPPGEHVLPCVCTPNVPMSPPPERATLGRCLWGLGPSGLGTAAQNLCTRYLVGCRGHPRAGLPPGLVQRPELLGKVRGPGGDAQLGGWRRRWSPRLSGVWPPRRAASMRSDRRGEPVRTDTSCGALASPSVGRPHLPSTPPVSCSARPPPRP